MEFTPSRKNWVSWIGGSLEMRYSQSSSSFCQLNTAFREQQMARIFHPQGCQSSISSARAKRIKEIGRRIPPDFIKDSRTLAVLGETLVAK